MHKDEIKGAAKTGDTRLQDEGTAHWAEGKLQQGVGNLKEAARNALKH